MMQDQTKRKSIAQDDHEPNVGCKKKIRTENDQLSCPPDNSRSMNHFLPHEILVQIFGYLDLKQLCRAAR